MRLSLSTQYIPYHILSVQTPTCGFCMWCPSPYILYCMLYGIVISHHMRGRDWQATCSRTDFTECSPVHPRRGNFWGIGDFALLTMIYIYKFFSLLYSCTQSRVIPHFSFFTFTFTFHQLPVAPPPELEEDALDVELLVTTSHHVVAVVVVVVVVVSFLRLFD